MEIIELKDRRIWRNFISANPGESGAEFLISPEWTDILSSENKTVKCLAVVENNTTNSENILGLIVLIDKFLGGGFNYWYAPRGPIFKAELLATEIIDIFNLFILAVKKLNKQAVFLKIEPAQILSGFWRINSRSNWQIGADIQPKKTLILNLKASEDNLLSAMHQKTRYNINLAKKKGVEIIEGDVTDFSELWRLMELTGVRDGFRIHDQKHYQNLISHSSSEFNQSLNKIENKKFIRLFFAQYQGRKIAAAIVCCFSDKATYLHGASDNEFRNIMAPYLLQWEIIKSVRMTGATIYDFYGIDAVKWPGVTRFKLGFGGEERDYPGVFDIIFRPFVYQIYNLAKRIRKILK